MHWQSACCKRNERKTKKRRKKAIQSKNAAVAAAASGHWRTLKRWQKGNKSNREEEKESEREVEKEHKIIVNSYRNRGVGINTLQKIHRTSIEENAQRKMLLAHLKPIHASLCNTLLYAGSTMAMYPDPVERINNEIEKTER